MSAPSSILVLHVDDDPGFRDVAEVVLSEEMENIVIESLPAASDGIERLDEGGIDCVISDYDMPGMNGLEFLEHVSERYPDLPFILFTGKGSEEVASDAISAGVTDYIQKGGGLDRFVLLANSIQNAVSHVRTRRAHRRQYEAIETAEEGIAILGDENRFSYVNQAYANLYDCDREELLDTHWSEFYSEEDVEFTREVVFPTVDSEGIWRGETTERRPNGALLVEDHIVSRTGTNDLIHIIHDITDKHRQEVELWRKTRAMEKAPIGIVITEPTRTDNPLVYVNEEFEALTGYSRDEILGENCRFLQGEQTCAERVEKLRTAVDNEEYVEVVLRNYRKDGTEFWNRVTVAPIRDESDTVVNFVGFQENVTEWVDNSDTLEVASEPE